MEEDIDHKVWVKVATHIPVEDRLVLTFPLLATEISQ